MLLSTVPATGALTCSCPVVASATDEEPAWTAAVTTGGWADGTWRIAHVSKRFETSVEAALLNDKVPKRLFVARPRPRSWVPGARPSAPIHASLLAYSLARC